MLRRTKIVATLGPATDDPAVLAEMVRAGLDVARINFSHGGREDARRRIVAVRAAAKAVGRPVGILGDLSGPKIRIESFVGGKILLTEGQPFALDVSLDPSAGNDHEVGCAYKDLPRDVKPGDTLLLADGFIILKVKSVAGPRIECEVLVGGELSNRKGLNKHGGGLSAPALTEKDIDDLKLAAELQVDYIAVSFARDAGRRPPCAGGAAQISRHGARRREDRTPRGDREPRPDPHRRRCRDGRARRPRRGDGLRRAHRHAEDHHRAGARGQPRRDHRDADDGVDDLEPRAHARGGLRRRQRGARRHRRGDAVGRNGHRQIPGEGRAGDGARDRGRREISSSAIPASRARKASSAIPKRRSPRR